MGGPVKIIVLGLLILISKANSQNIVAINDNVDVEQLDESRYIITMDENNHEFDDGHQPDTPLFKIVGANSKPTVSFFGTAFSHNIIEDETDSTTFYVHATQSFDYETQERVYRFNLDLNTGDIPLLVTFNINNIDDEPPSLTIPPCTFDENTIYTKDNSTCSGTVSDPDGWLAQMTFTIIDTAGGEKDIFAIEYREVPDDLVYEALVYVTVREMLDYQSVTFYLFDVEAKDGAEHATTPNPLVRVIIYVNDLPDTPPIWTNYFTFQQFKEQEEQSFNVTAIDGDFGLNYEINYKKLWEDDEEADYISIDKNGKINVKKIDRDKDDITMYNFEIMAYEVPNAPIWNTSLAISFYIIDIDNNPPLVIWIQDASFDNVTFDETDEKVTSMSFLENFAGTLNLSVYIRDIDTGDNARFTVQLEDLEENEVKYTEAFLIVPTAEYRKGHFEISVKNVTYLDYEVPEWDHISFNVLTKGALDESKQDRLLVKIDLIDYNDEIPKFDQPDYEISINETAKKGEIIIEILATDRDAEDKILNHTLIGSKYTDRVLAIESDTGIIYVNDDNAFDYDTVNPIFVQVKATDKVGHYTTVPLTINLLDVNNKAPTISPGEPINVDENQNSTVKLNASITASDMDTTAYLTAEIDWDRSYAMKNSRKLNMSDEAIFQQVKFLDVSYYSLDVDDEEYVRDIGIDLVVNDDNPDGTTPDYELFDSLFLYLVVRDWNTDPEFMDKNSTGSIILISINDINDNTPFFPEAELPEEERTNRTVQEYAPEGTSVGNIIAIDLDVDDTVTYDCLADDPNFDWVDLNPNTGAFTVKDSNLIDADTHKTFYFNYTCTASDNGYTHTSDPLSVRFYIIDTNNKIPVITIDPVVSVDEKSPADTVVSPIGTSDADRDIPFHTVQCDFVRPLTGPCVESFEIKDNVLVVKWGGADINRDEGIANYTCDLYCQDNPYKLQNDNNPHTVPLTVYIQLKDINDHTPEVLTTDIPTSENVHADDIIHTIRAIDIDEGDNAEIVFNITKVVNDNGDEVFDLFDVETDDDYYVDLTHKQTNLIALKDLKGEYGTYTLTIGVADKGTPPNSAFYDVTVQVEKFNFEAPRFIFPSSEGQVFILLSSQEQNSPLILFRKNDSEYLDNFYATDNSESDVCEKWDVYFTFNQTNPTGDTIFTIVKDGMCSGQLQVNNRYNVDAVLGETYNLDITASVREGEPLEGEAPYFAERKIVINFLDNNQKPVFSTFEFPFSFLEEDETQTIELPYKASYQVEDSEDLPIFYFLVTPNETIAQLFAVDELTGTISLKDKLDYETDEEFEFQIVASNDTTPTSNNPDSYLNVICSVIDINDNVPQWVRPNFFGAIMSGYIRNTPILTVEATDADKIDQGKLTYYINGSITPVGSGLTNVPADSFLMTPTTGEIRLNFQVDNIMTGYFQFDVTVWDVQDDYGNGPHWNTTDVTILIITNDNTVDFRFLNTIEQVQDQEQGMLAVVSRVLLYDAYKQNIDKEVVNGEEQDDHTFASLYFIDGSLTEAVEASTILRLVSNINTFSQLGAELINETGLILLSFPSNASASENLEEILKAWLIGVSVVLGALCLILLVSFILKTREYVYLPKTESMLNSRITKLTTKKFGSQESGLNRLGISAPTTNKHAIEGSNPMFNLSSEEVKKDLRDFDEASMRSGDSDLIGVEDSPQFDYELSKTNGVSQHI